MSQLTQATLQLFSYLSNAHLKDQKCISLIVRYTIDSKSRSSDTSSNSIRIALSLSVR